MHPMSSISQGMHLQPAPITCLLASLQLCLLQLSHVSIWPAVTLGSSYYVDGSVFRRAAQQVPITWDTKKFYIYLNLANSKRCHQQLWPNTISTLTKAKSLTSGAV